MTTEIENKCAEIVIFCVLVYVGMMILSQLSLYLFIKYFDSSISKKCERAGSTWRIPLFGTIDEMLRKQVLARVSTKGFLRKQHFAGWFYPPKEPKKEMRLLINEAKMLRLYSVLPFGGLGGRAAFDAENEGYIYAIESCIFCFPVLMKQAIDHELLHFFQEERQGLLTKETHKCSFITRVVRILHAEYIPVAFTPLLLFPVAIVIVAAYRLIDNAL